MTTPSPTTEPRRRLHCVAAALCLVCAVVVAVVLSAEVVYRLRLFWFAYDGHPGINHVADGYFSTVYAASAAAAGLALTAALMLRALRWHLVSYALAAVNAALLASFAVMHHTAALVTYSEFVAAYGP